MNASTITATQVRALVWEETRVGGAIAGVCAFVGALLLLANRVMYGEAAWTRDEFTSHFAALGVPLLTGLLLILNPDYSGHLTGGFSKRVLRLPVQTPIAVAIPLLVRVTLIFGVSAALLSLAGVLFSGVPGFPAVCLIVLVYLAAQTIDWLRGPLRGMTSLAVLAVAALIAYWIWPNTPPLTPIESGIALAERSPLTLPLAVVVSLALAYAITAPLVHAGRTGRYYGVPEIWEWPGQLRISSRGYAGSFRSPFVAQVWFEVRRSRFLLPLIFTAGATVYVALWIYFAGNAAGGDDARTDLAAFRRLSGYLLFSSVLLAAAAHGIQTRVIGFRKTSRSVGYEYLQPLTDAQFAMARVIAGALLLVPVLVVAQTLHIAVAGPIVANVLPEALRSGVASAREAAWILLSRGLLIALIAWPLLALGTRLFRTVVVVPFLLFIAMGLADILIDTDLIEAWQGNLALAMLLLIVITLVMGGRAWWTRAAPARTLAGWAVAWLLLAWLLRYPLIMIWSPEAVPTKQNAFVLLAALAIAALLPLVFLATLSDVRRRRLGIANHRHDPAQHASPRRMPVSAMIAAASVTALIAWLGWPAQPAYVAFRQERGYPVTLNDLDAWYPEPPAGQNVAPDYLKASVSQQKLVREYTAWFRRGADMILKGGFIPRHASVRRDFYDYLFIVGSGELPRTGPIDRQVWSATESYWKRVTSNVVPPLQQLSQRDTAVSKYPVEVRKGYHASLPHLEKLRVLNRELLLDTAHWTLASKPDKAVDSILAGFALSSSFQNEPYLMSFQQRVALANTTLWSIEWLLNRSVPADRDLARLQEACSRLLTGIKNSADLDHVIIGESTMQLSDRYYIFRDHLNPFDVLQGMIFPVAGQNVAFSLELEQTLQHNANVLAKRRPDYDGDADEYYSKMYFLTPVVGMLSPSFRWTRDANGRFYMALEITRAALAVERYRLANNKLPDTLAALVPQFLPEIPEDYFAPSGVPVMYRIRDNGEYVVYSVGRDREDNQGTDDRLRETRGSPNGKDITITVAPMSARRGPHLSGAEAP